MANTPTQYPEVLLLTKGRGKKIIFLGVSPKSVTHKTKHFRFPKLTLLLSVVHLQGLLLAFECKSSFFVGHPVVAGQ